MFKSEKLNQLLSEVKPEQKNKSFSDEIFLEDFNLSTYDGVFDYDEFSNHVSQAGLINWICTDTEVGVYAYYLNDEFIAISFQPARKSDKQIVWVNDDLREKMREFIVSIYNKNSQLDQFYLIDDEVTDDIIQSYQSSKIQNDNWNKEHRKHFPFI